MQLGSTGPDTPAVMVAQSPASAMKDQIFSTTGFVFTLPQRMVCTVLGHPKNIVCGRTGWDTIGGDVLFTAAFNGAVWYGVYKLITRKGRQR